MNRLHLAVEAVFGRIILKRHDIGIIAQDIQPVGAHGANFFGSFFDRGKALQVAINMREITIGIVFLQGLQGSVGARERPVKQ